MKPVLQALVVADRVYREIGGKTLIAGTFSGFKFSKRPPIAEITLPDGSKKRAVMGGASAGSPYAYVSLTDVCDGTKLQIEFVNLSKNIIMFGNELTISNNDRLRNIELILPLPTLPIAEEGIYALQLLCEGQILGSWRIVAEDMDAKKNEERPDGPCTS